MTIEKVTAYKTNDYDVTEDKNQLIRKERETIVRKYLRVDTPNLESAYELRWSRPDEDFSYKYSDRKQRYVAGYDKGIKRGFDTGFEQGNREAIDQFMKFYDQIMAEFKEKETA